MIKQEILGGRQLIHVQTEDGCLKACLEDSTCRAADFHTKQQMCYLHETRMGDRDNAAGYSVLYNLAACPTSTICLHVYFILVIYLLGEV